MIDVNETSHIYVVVPLLCSKTLGDNVTKGKKVEKHEK